MLKGVLLFTMYTRQSSRESVKRGSIVAVDILGNACEQTDLIYAQTEAQKVIIDSQAQATKRAQEGYTYAQERGFDVAQTVAANEAVGQFTNMGVGLGTMAGVGGVVGGVVGNAVNGAMNAAAETPAPASAAPLFKTLSIML